MRHRYIYIGRKYVLWSSIVYRRIRVVKYTARLQIAFHAPPNQTDGIRDLRDERPVQRFQQCHTV